MRDRSHLTACFVLVRTGRYYEQHHAVVSSGSAFRGYRDCYFDKTLKDTGVKGSSFPDVLSEDTLCSSIQHGYLDTIGFVRASAGPKRHSVGDHLEPSEARAPGCRSSGSRLSAALLSSAQLCSALLGSARLCPLPGNIGRSTCNWSPGTSHR